MPEKVTLMFRSVLVPLDSSPLGEQALPAALAICQRTGAQLHLLHVRAQYAVEGFALADDPARAYLDDLAARVGAELDAPVSSGIVPEASPTLLKPAPAPDTIAAVLAQYAQQRAVDLIVLTTHGRSGLSRLWFGSVAEALLRRSHAPLLLIRPTEEGDADPGWTGEQPLKRILIPVDGSDVSHRAVELAASFGTLFGADYTLLRVVPLPYEVLGGLSAVTVAYTGQDVEESVERARAGVEQEAETLRSAGGTVTTDVIIDPSPGRAILRYTRDRDVDIVALASRARSGLDRFLLGSVADKVIRGGETPLLILQPDPAGQAAGNEAFLAEAEITDEEA